MRPRRPTETVAFQQERSRPLVSGRSWRRPEFLELLALFFRQNLLKLLSHFFVQIRELLHLVLAQVQLVSQMRRHEWWWTARTRTTGGRTVTSWAATPLATILATPTASTTIECIGATATPAWTVLRRTEFTAIAGSTTTTLSEMARTRWADLIARQFAVVVFVERLECLAGARDFFSRNRAVVVGVKCLHYRRRRRRSLTTRSSSASRWRSIGRLRERHCSEHSQA